MSQYRRRLGAEGEDAAARWYEERGFVVAERNWRCREGEIDLVVSRPGLLVVCEVKTRTSARYGGGAAAVDARKQRTIRQVSAVYLRERSSRSSRPIGRVRFDVAVVSAGAHGFAVDVIEGAF